MNEGHFDDIRKKVIDSLRHNESLKQFTMKLLDESDTLAAADLSTNANRKKILDDLRKELEDKVLDAACKEAWGVMTTGEDSGAGGGAAGGGDMSLGASSSSSSSIACLIDEKVHEALCVLHEKRAAQADAHAHALAGQQQQLQQLQQQQQHGGWGGGGRQH
ncbi:hypothetical protein FOA52_006336 [Chlamydomonas sp. UWO 241]|nr:hypothetical protein FOA52_006336 [Chlamydomonas sp. UWO 241]